MWSQNGTARRFHFWDRDLGSIFGEFCIKVAEAKSFGFNEALWLMATERQLGRPFERSRFDRQAFQDPELRIVGASCFVV